MRAIIDHITAIINGLDKQPIIMGHSFGGTITQLLMDRGLGCSGVVVDSAPTEGVRVNLVAAGPLETLAKKAIGGADEFNTVWGSRAPLGWDVQDAEPTARACVALMSDWFPKTTGSIVHVDGGFHAVGV